MPTLKLIRNPRKCLEEWRDTYGDPFFLHALNGPVFVTGREDLIRQLYSYDPDLFLQFADKTMIPILGRGSIFSFVGADHRRERRMLTPMFQGDRMKAYGPDMQQLTMEHAERTLASGRFDTLSVMTDISFGVIVQNIFGGTSREQMENLVRASKRMIKGMHPLLFFSKRAHVSFFGLSPWDRFVRARRELDQLMDELIAERRRSNQEHHDILTMLCKTRDEAGEPLKDFHIRDELVTFLFAGHETTALSLTWAMYHLHRHREVLTRLLEELDGIDAQPASLATAPYLKACVQETLRVHPIVTETLRKVKEPIELGEYRIPANCGVAPATVLAHYNPETYPEPDRFRPERFFDRSYSPFTFMPFGGGHRRCIGAAFASYEMTIVLGTLLKQYRFDLVEAREVTPKRRNVTIGPSSNVPMTIARR